MTNQNKRFLNTLTERLRREHYRDTSELGDYGRGSHEAFCEVIEVDNDADRYAPRIEGFQYIIQAWQDAA